MKLDSISNLNIFRKNSTSASSIFYRIKNNVTPRYLYSKPIKDEVCFSNAISFGSEECSPEDEWRKFSAAVNSCNTLNTNQDYKNHIWEIRNEILKKGQGKIKNGILNRIIKETDLQKSEVFMAYIGDFIHCAQTNKSHALADKIMDNEDFFKYEYNMKYAATILWFSQNDSDEVIDLKCQLFDKIFQKPLNKKYTTIAGEILFRLSYASKEKVQFALNAISDKRVYADIIPAMLDFYHDVDEDALKAVMGDKNLSCAEKQIASRFLNFYQINSVDEIPNDLKKAFINGLLTFNASFFNLSSEFQNDFPLIPKSQEEYCERLQAAVSSLDIKTNSLNENEQKQFFSNVDKLASVLSNMSDKEFSELSITQNYSQEQFIKDVINKTETLTPAQRQKVCAAFGFGIYQNDKSPTGYSISGYPYPQEESLSTEAELIRENVENYVNKNEIICSNKSIEKLLNEILKAIPELRATISRVQSEGHEFDVFKHSLKVLQKIAQNNSLPEKDRKIAFLAALLHDISKKEGIKDKNYDTCSALDTTFIAKKLNLSEDEKYKLYTLIANHHFLETIANAQNNEETVLKQVAYRLRYDNMLDLAKVFCSADLKALKKDDSFFNEKRDLFDNTIKKIKEHVSYLQETQAVLPCERLPKASTILSHIKQINSDGSTDIKGVYVGDGESSGKRLVILKFNDIEDGAWAKIGFPKGTNSDRVRFFAHGLKNENSLANFTKFSLPSSDEIISASYLINPRVKYKLFMPQGIALICKTQDIHATLPGDYGIGYKKKIPKFSEECFNDINMRTYRTMFSDLIKSQNPSINFSHFYNKTFSQIAEENKDDVYEIIRCLQNLEPFVTDKGKTYNEIFISNPEAPMGVWAYDEEGEKIVDPVEYLKKSKNTKFLQDYAKKSDIPFILFGD